MSNAVTKSMKLRTFMASAAFKQGFNDVIKGIWSEVEHWERAWQYERGRQFAVVLRQHGIDPSTYRWKQGRTVLQHAMSDYLDFRRRKEIL